MQTSVELVSPEKIIGGSQIRQLIGRHEAYAAGKLKQDRNLPQDVVLDHLSEAIESKLSEGRAKAKGLLGRTRRLVGLAVTERSDWDTAHFGKRMGKMSLAVFDDTVPAANRSKLIRASFRESGLEMVSARVNLADLRTIQALESEGARLTDVLLSFRFYTASWDSTPTLARVEVGPVSKGEAKKLIGLGRKAFTIDRFHGDQNIPSAASDALYSEWVANSMKGLADMVFVARVNEEVAGFITCKLDQLNEDCKYGVIDLIAVDASYEGKGIGHNLVRSALGWFAPRVRSVYVGTQAANSGAIRLYEKSGFSHVCSEATLHLWSESEL